MPIEVTMPKLSPTMETGVIAQWLVKVGDQIKEGDTLADIETDKATMPMKSYDDGTIVHIDHAAGDEVSLGQRVMVLAKKGEDPKKVVARLQMQRNRLQGFRSSLTKLCTAASDASFSKRDSLRAEWDRKAQAARLASEELFAASPLPDVGKDIWRALWEAARRYSDQVAYPAKKFPEAIAEEDLCVLCQQPLTKKAVDRRQTFEGFVRGSTKADEDQAAKAYNEFVAQGASTRSRTQVRRDAVAFFEAEIGDEALAAIIRKVTTVAAWRLRAFVKGKGPNLPAHAFPETECNALDVALSQRITQLSADEKSPEWLALFREHRELKDRQALRPLLADIKAEIVRRQTVTVDVWGEVVGVLKY